MTSNAVQRNMIQQMVLGGQARGDARLNLAFFVYTVSIANVASGAQGQGQVSIQADSDFMIYQLNSFATSNNAVVSQPIATVQLTDSGSGQTLFDNAVPISSVTGSGELPFVLPVPRLMSASSLLVVNVNNLFSANPVTYYFQFIGTKIYRM